MIEHKTKKFPWIAFIILIIVTIAALVYYSLGGTLQSAKTIDPNQDNPSQPAQNDNTLPPINNSMELQ